MELHEGLVCSSWRERVGVIRAIASTLKSSLDKLLSGNVRVLGATGLGVFLEMTLLLANRTAIFEAA